RFDVPHPPRGPSRSGGDLQRRQPPSARRGARARLHVARPLRPGDRADDRWRVLPGRRERRASRPLRSVTPGNADGARGVARPRRRARLASRADRPLVRRRRARRPGAARAGPAERIGERPADRGTPRAMASCLIYACGVIIAVAMIAVARVDPRVSPHEFFACLGSAGMSYLAVVWLLPRARLESRSALVFCLGLAALWRVPLLLSPPPLSTDVYRYVWDGRLQHLGYDPYTVIPDDPAVAKLHDRETQQMNHRSLPTPYPPVAEFFFRLATWPSTSVRTMKAALVLCDALLVIVLLRWLDASGRDAVRVLGYAWNPLVALEVAGNGHVDVLGALFLVLPAWC